MRFLTKLAIGTIVSALLAFGALAVAQAAPGKSPQSEIIDLQCDSLGDIQVAVSSTSDNANENAPAWGVGHVVGSNTVLIPFSFDFEGTFTPTDGAPEPFSFSQVKGNGNAGPANGTYDTCTFTESGSDATGTFEATGTVVALISGGSK